MRSLYGFCHRRQWLTNDFLANVPAPDMNLGSPAARFLMLPEILELDRYLLYRYYDAKTG